MENLNRKEVEKSNRVEVSLRSKVKLVVWFVLAMLLLAVVGILRSVGKL